MSARPAFANTQPAVCFGGCACSAGKQVCDCVPDVPEMAPEDPAPVPLDWSGALMALGAVALFLTLLFLYPAVDWNNLK